MPAPGVLLQQATTDTVVDFSAPPVLQLLVSADGWLDILDSRPNYRPHRSLERSIGARVQLRQRCKDLSQFANGIAVQALQAGDFDYAAERFREAAAYSAAGHRPGRASRCFALAADAAARSSTPWAALHDLEWSVLCEADPASKLRTMIRQGLLAVELDAPTTATIWGSVARLASALRDNEAYAMAHLHLYWSDCDGSSHDRLERAVAVGPITCGWSARAAACQAMLQGDYEASIRFDTLASQTARITGDRVLESMAQEKMSVAYSFCFNTDKAIDSLKHSINCALEAQQWRTAITRLLTLSDMYSEALDSAAQKEMCEQALDIASRRTDSTMIATAMAFLASAHANCGDLESATSIVGRAQKQVAAPHGCVYLTAALCQIAHIAIDVGSVPTATRAVHDALAATTELGFESLTVEAEFDRMRLAMMRSDTQEALTHALSLTPKEHDVTARVALWMLRAGTWQDIPELVQRAIELAKGLENSKSAIGQLALREIAATQILSSTRDSRALLDVAQAWSDCGRKLEAARVRATIAISTAAQGCSDSSMDNYFEAALDELISFGAGADADVVQKIARKLGGSLRYRSTHLLGKDEIPQFITQREWEVAKLIQLGESNTNIAVILHVSVSTVEKYVGNLLRKLGMKSRVRLAAWMDERQAVGVT